MSATHAGADIVTRRSVLGASGRVGYLAGANGSWVLVRRDGSVRGGGAVEDARRMTHDVATGQTQRAGLGHEAKWSSTDPLDKVESDVRRGVLVLAGAVVLMSLVAAWSVFFGS